MTPEENGSILKLATAVGSIGARIDAMEQARTLARAEDHEWREGVAGDIADIKACITEMPSIMDTKIDACRNEREAVTHDAVEDSTRRHVLAAIATDWRTWAAFLVAVAGFGIGVLR